MEADNNTKHDILTESGYEVCHVSSRMFTSYHRIRIGWLYAPADVKSRDMYILSTHFKAALSS